MYTDRFCFLQWELDVEGYVAVDLEIDE
jgi:hypothetical protein